MNILMTTNILKNVILKIKKLRNDSSFKKVEVMADKHSENNKIEFLFLTLNRLKRVLKKLGILNISFV